MLKTAKVYIIIIVFMALMATPFTTGWLFQQQYRKLIQYYNESGEVEIKIQSYQMGWLNSKAVLLVKIPKKTLRYILAPLSSQDFPDGVDFILRQNIHHGPVFYREIQYALGLATINTQLVLPEISKKALELIGIRQLSLGNNDALATFFGNYFKRSELGKFQISDPKRRTSLQFNQFDLNAWIIPREFGFHGGVDLDELSYIANQNELLIPHVAVRLDQDLKENSLTDILDVKIPKIRWDNARITLFSLSNIHANGFIHAQNNEVSLHHRIDIDELKLENQRLGPLHLDVAFDQLNADVIAGLFSAYKKIMGEGELYRDQLQKKLSLLLPGIIDPGTNMTIHSFSLMTDNGRLQLTGKLTWPITRSGSPEHWTDFLTEGVLSCSIRISQALTNQLIGVLAQFPSVQPYTLDERQYLLALQDEVNTAFQFNSGLLSRLLNSGAISKQIAEELYDLGSDHDLADQYLSAIKLFYLNKQISLYTSYILYLQFSYLQHVASQFEAALVQHENAIKRKLFLNIKNWVKQGYILVDKDDYVVLISRDESGLMISNGRIVKMDD